jgi:hypothetical protein
MRWECGCLSIALLLAVATNVGALAAEKIKPPLALETMGHFFAGGVVVNRTSPDPIFPGGPLFSDQKVLVNQAYVEFLIPTKLHKGQAPILLAHNSINGTIWQTTPDGREGWEEYFARRGFATYVVDPPGVGRAGFHDIDQINLAARGRIAPLTTNPLSRSDTFQWTQWNVGTTFPQLGDGQTSGNQMANDPQSQINWLAQLIPQGPAVATRMATFISVNRKDQSSIWKDYLYRLVWRRHSWPSNGCS